VSDVRRLHSPSVRLARDKSFVGMADAKLKELCRLLESMRPKFLGDDAGERHRARSAALRLLEPDGAIHLFDAADLRSPRYATAVRQFRLVAVRKGRQAMSG